MKKQLEKDNWKVVDKQTIYYPYYFFEMVIKYKSFLRQNRSAKKIVASNAVTGGTSFSDIIPTIHELEIENEEVIPIEQDDKKSLEEATEMVRKHYIHQVRIWSLPTISLTKQEIVYLPYTIFTVSKEGKSKSQLYLYEHLSNNHDKLKNSPLIENAFHNLRKRREATWVC